MAAVPESARDAWDDAGRGCLRVVAATLVTGVIGAVIWLARDALDRFGLVIPIGFGALSFSWFAVKMVSGRHTDGFVPFGMALVIAGTVGAFVAVAGCAAQLLLPGVAVGVRVATAVALIGASVIAGQRPFAAWVTRRWPNAPPNVF